MGLIFIKEATSLRFASDGEGRFAPERLILLLHP